MRKSKKLFLIIALLAACLVIPCVAAACGPSEYTVTFVADGEVVDTQTFTKEDKNINEPQVPTKTGYTGAWEEYTLEDKDLTVNAVYKAKTYIVTLDYDGADGNIGVSQITVTYDQPIGELPSPTKTGYEFDGWLHEQSSFYVTSSSYWEYDYESATLVARWTAVNKLKFKVLNDNEVGLTGIEGKITSEIVIPETYEGKTVVTIEEHAFFALRNVTKITLPDSIRAIYMNAFANCSSLTTVNIPYGVTTIANSSFSGCSSLESLTLPNSVTRIYANAFQNCVSLSNITLSDELTVIDLFAFKGCSSLASVNIPGKVYYIGDSAFCGTGLTSISIPQSVTQLHKNAFAECENLTSVTFEATDGWFYTDSMMATSGTDIDASALANPTTAAQYLTGTYCNYYWKRNVSE